MQWVARVVPLCLFLVILAILAVLPGRMRAQNETVKQFWVQLRSRPQFQGLESITDHAARGQFVFDELHRHAADSQQNVVSLLESRGVQYRSFWISNAVLVSADQETADLLSTLPDVESVTPDEPIVLSDPPAPEALSAAVTDTVEWNVAETHAREVWTNFGATGRGVVVGVIDTGFAFHPALTAKYRGNLGNGQFNHNYNWYDATPTHQCALTPCDPNGHGTHVTGTILGSDGSYIIGVAPDAKFISCRGLDANGVAAPADILKCMEWFLAPTDLNGANPNPALRPSIINNSWGGGRYPAFDRAVDAWRAAGILPVFAAGNSGSSCSSIQWPGAYSGALAVGALSYGGGPEGFSLLIASFSSRGPVPNVADLYKPDVVAGGQNVTSSWINNSYRTISGTSMAAPAVSGVAALLYSAAPQWATHPDSTANLLRKTAFHINSADCASAWSAPNGYPNCVYGFGEIDAYMAVQEGLRTVP